jgi:hypothetical protein
VFVHHVAVDCVARTSDECAASIFVLKVTIERNSHLRVQETRKWETGGYCLVETNRSNEEQMQAPFFSGPKVGPEAHDLQSVS